MFEQGTRVKHKAFGKGTVIEKRETGTIVLFDHQKIGMERVSEDDLETYRGEESFNQKGNMEQRIEEHKEKFVIVRHKHEEGKKRVLSYTARPF